jgi:hypothetical protein
MNNNSNSSSQSMMAATNMSSLPSSDVQNTSSQSDGLKGTSSIQITPLLPERVKLFKSSIISTMRATHEQDCSLDQVLSQINHVTFPPFSIEEAEAILRDMEASNMCMYREGHIYLCS